MNCSKCNAVLEASDEFCGECGQPVRTTTKTPAAESMTVPASPAIKQAAGPRSRWPAVVLLLAVIVAVAAVMMFKNSSPGSSSAIPGPAPTTSSVDRSTSGSTSGSTPAGNSASIETARIEPNVFDPSGRFGLRLHGKLHVDNLETSRFVAHFFDGSGAALKGTDPNFTDTGGQVAASSPIATPEDQVIFVPYSALGLQPGQYTIQVLPNVSDSSGKNIGQGSSVPLNYTEYPSSILKVQVQPDSADQVGARGVLITTSFVSEPLRGPRGMVGIHFKNLDSGQPLPGRDPTFTDGSGNLVAAREYSASSERSLYSDVTLFLPLDQIGQDVRALRAEISLFDPAQNRFLTPFIPFDIQLPARLGAR